MYCQNNKKTPGNNYTYATVALCIMAQMLRGRVRFFHEDSKSTNISTHMTRAKVATPITITVPITNK